VKRVQDLLFLAHRIPFPPNKGDKIRSFHILRHLASRFKVHLGCFCDEAADQRHIAPLRELCSEVFCLPLGRTQIAMRSLRAVALGKSISEASYRDRRMSAWIRDTLGKHEIKDIFVFCSAMAPYVLGCCSDRRVVIDIVDLDSAKWEAYARSAPWPLSTLYRFEQRNVFLLERQAAAACDRALFVSKAEANAFLNLAPELSGRVEYLENGVDLDRFDPAHVFPNPFGKGKSTIVFTGAMNYRPNVDAVVWFVQEAFPAIRRTHAGAEFWIVGANPTASVRRLSRQAGVRVTGAVSDVRPYIANADCAVAPLRLGRGVQNKVLEAMAMAKPVVLTLAAHEGLNAIPGEEVLLANSGWDFARCVSDVLSGQWNEMGRAARARVELDHRWPQNLNVLDQLFPQPPAPAAAQPEVGSAPWI